MPSPLSIDEANEQQIADYASKFLNLDVPAGSSPAQVRALVEQAQPGVSMIFVDSAPEPDIERIEPPAMAQTLADEATHTSGTLGKGDPRAVIQIPELPDTDGRLVTDVGVGVGGHVWQLKRGVKLDVPWRVVEALRLCIERQVRHSETGDVIERDVERFPFSILSGPSAAEIAEWQKQTADAFCP